MRANYELCATGAACQIKRGDWPNVLWARCFRVCSLHRQEHDLFGNQHAFLEERTHLAFFDLRRTRGKRRVQDATVMDGEGGGLVGACPTRFEAENFFSSY